MKHTFVGDIHGKVEVVERALSQDGSIIFVGDFMDSFDRSPKEHEQCLRLVLDAIKTGKARAIYGNHELSYLMSVPHACSGFRTEHRVIMDRYAAEVREHFEPFILLKPDFLVTHAGLTKQIWAVYRLSAAMKNGTLGAKLQAWWKDRCSPMHWIGQRRGGHNSVGGTFWCDFNVEFQPVKGLHQVFGHTRRGEEKGIRVVDLDGYKSYCIDCLDHPGRRFDFLELDI